ncbi:MAG TPA: NAD(P)-binding domain-containing protein, partial [Pyrinomonadaceae bacterium]|nr:NAD(P)-binding domain-containing protein [Pyrinomonadaceae bacterium]
MNNLPHSSDTTKTLSPEVQIAFVGCGVMAEAILAGILRQELLKPEQITGSHPRESRRNELQAKYGIRVFADNREAATEVQ